MKVMSSHTLHNPRRVFAIGVSFVVLAICEALLIFDVLIEFFGVYSDFYSDYHLELESLAVFALGVCLIILGVEFWRLLQDNRSYRAMVELASGEFLRVLYKKFDDWKLTLSEREVALLLIKGLSIVEIAEVRNTMAGTIKSQSNAIYRKAEVNGRNELVAYFVEDLLCGHDLLGTNNEELIKTSLPSA